MFIFHKHAQSLVIDCDVLFLIYTRLYASDASEITLKICVYCKVVSSIYNEQRAFVETMR